MVNGSNFQCTYGALCASIIIKTFMHTGDQFYVAYTWYGNPNVTKLSKFKLKGTKVQSYIWKGANL